MRVIVARPEDLTLSYRRLELDDEQARVASGSWLTVVETLFSMMTRQAIRRGTFPSAADL